MMEKMKMQSPDFTATNIAQLASLFPNCVTESADQNGNLKKSIDFDLLRQELSTSIVEGPQERYHLNWPGKREALLTANAPIAKTLRPCREGSVDFDTTENLFIEGDNLDALKLMQETYLGKIKMIYIDPPYNTGKDFIYSDNFMQDTEEYLLGSGQKDGVGNRLVANTDSNGRFHSDWLSMMYPRLKLARNLLKDNGVIFISIDNEEVANLRRVCDEVFGEANFVESFVWVKKTAPNNVVIGAVHEYVLVYAKSVSEIKLYLLPRTAEQNKDYKNPDDDPRGLWKPDNLTAAGKGGRATPSLIYEVENPKTGEKFSPPDGRMWAVNKEDMKKKISEGSVYWGKSGAGRPMDKRFLAQTRQGSVASTLLNQQGSNSEASKELQKLFNGKVVFETPKPSRLIQHLLKIGAKDNDIVLDFFAGSAATADAVMQLNAKDHGKRKFIMVQIPEACNEQTEVFRAGFKDIAEISKERIRRARNKIIEEHPKAVENLDTGFRVLKVDSSNMADVYYTPDDVIQDKLNLSADNIKDDRTSEDLLFQVLLDWAVDLTLPIYKDTIEEHQVFFVDGNALVACFEKDGKITEDFCKDLAERKPLRVVFRDSGFKDDSVKINVEQIFKLMSPHTDVKTI